MAVKQETGRVNVYICHCQGFHEKTRPAYDSAPMAYGEMTDSQVRTLSSIIARYVRKCHERNEKKKAIIAALNAGS